MASGTTAPRVVRIASAVVAVVLSLVLVAGLAYGYVLWRAFDTSLVRYAVSVSPSDATIFAAPDGINILLVGTDDRSRLSDEEVEKYATGRTDTVNTDTIMILHIPPSGVAGDVPVSLVSVPRDSWVDFHGTDETDKINAAYEIAGGGAAGLSLLAQTVTDVTGMPIQHTLMVDFASFARITEAVGPVEVCLKQATYDPETGLELPAGPQVLDPDEALKFVRQRHGLPNGDLDRVKRQQAYLTAAAHAVISNVGNPSYMRNLVATAGENLFVDEGFDVTAQGAAASQVTKRVMVVPVRTETLPVTDIDARREGKSVVLLDDEAIPEFVAALDQPTPAVAPTPSATPTVSSSPTVSATPEPDGSADWESDPSCVY